MSPWQRRTLFGKLYILFQFQVKLWGCNIYMHFWNSQIALEHEKWPYTMLVKMLLRAPTWMTLVCWVINGYLQRVTSGSDLHMIIILYCKGDTFTNIRIHGTSSHHPFLAVCILLLPPSEIDHVRISLDLHTGPTGPAGTKQKITSELFYQLFFRETGIIKILPKRRVEDVASINLPTRKVTQQAGKSPNL